MLGNNTVTIFGVILVVLVAGMECGPRMRRQTCTLTCPANGGIIAGCNENEYCRCVRIAGRWVIYRYTCPAGTVFNAATLKCQAAAATTTVATTPAVTTPAVTTPAVTTPAVTTPAVTTPAVTTPAVTTPAVTTPAVTTPAVTTPTVTTPAVTTEATTNPSS